MTKIYKKYNCTNFFWHSTQNKIGPGEILEKIELVSFENTVEVRTNT